MTLFTRTIDVKIGDLPDEFIIGKEEFDELMTELFFNPLSRIFKYRDTQGVCRRTAAEDDALKKPVFQESDTWMFYRMQESHRCERSEKCKRDGDITTEAWYWKNEDRVRFRVNYVGSRPNARFYDRSLNKYIRMLDKILRTKNIKAIYMEVS